MSDPFCGKPQFSGVWNCFNRGQRFTNVRRCLRKKSPSWNRGGGSTTAIEEWLQRTGSDHASRLSNQGVLTKCIGHRPCSREKVSWCEAWLMIRGWIGLPGTSSPSKQWNQSRCATFMLRNGTEFASLSIEVIGQRGMRLHSFGRYAQEIIYAC